MDLLKRLTTSLLLATGIANADTPTVTDAEAEYKASRIELRAASDRVIELSTPQDDPSKQEMLTGSILEAQQNANEAFTDVKVARNELLEAVCGDQNVFDAVINRPDSDCATTSKTVMKDAGNDINTGAWTNDPNSDIERIGVLHTLLVVLLVTKLTTTGRIALVNINLKIR